MGRTSSELLQLEHKNSPSTSSLESSLLVCKKESQESQRKKSNPDEKPTTAPVPRSQGKVKNFLGVISEANKRLQLDAKDNSGNYDIEVLNGNESQVIEMDLMLGIADLHTPDAVAAAESAIAGCQPVIPLPISSETESDDSSDEDDECDGNYHDEEDGSENEDAITVSSAKLKRSKSAKGTSSGEIRNNNSLKRPKIVEL